MSIYHRCCLVACDHVGLHVVMVKQREIEVRREFQYLLYIQFVRVTPLPFACLKLTLIDGILEVWSLNTRNVLSPFGMLYF